jgi:hypothetical protein
MSRDANHSQFAQDAADLSRRQIRFVTGLPRSPKQWPVEGLFRPSIENGRGSSPVV